MKRLLEKSSERRLGRRLLEKSSLEKSNIVNCKSISDRLLATLRRFSEDFYRRLQKYSNGFKTEKASKINFFV